MRTIYHVMKTQSPILCGQNEQQKMTHQLWGRQSEFHPVLTSKYRHKVQELNDIHTHCEEVPSSVCVCGNPEVGRVC